MISVARQISVVVVLRVTEVSVVVVVVAEVWPLAPFIEPGTSFAGYLVPFVRAGEWARATGAIG